MTKVRHARKSDANSDSSSRYYFYRDDAIKMIDVASKKGERIEFVDAWFDVDSDETPEGIKLRAADQIT